MRPDFDTLICEEPRRGGSRAFRDVRRYNNREHNFGGELPKMESHKRAYERSSLKSFGDHVQPLRRFLEKQVGRPWNLVRSEIVATGLKKDSTTHIHVWQHIRGWVEEKVDIENGRVYPRAWYRRGHRPPLRPGDLYVHPVDGLLKMVREPKRKRKAVTEPVRQMTVREYLDAGYVYIHQQRARASDGNRVVLGYEGSYYVFTYTHNENVVSLVVGDVPVGIQRYFSRVPVITSWESIRPCDVNERVRGLKRSRVPKK